MRQVVADAVAAREADAQTKYGYVVGPDDGAGAILGGNPAILVEFISLNDQGLPQETAIFITLYQGKEYELDFVTLPENEDAFVASAKDVFESWQFT